MDGKIKANQYVEYTQLHDSRERPTGHSEASRRDSSVEARSCDDGHYHIFDYHHFGVDGPVYTRTR
jgi:hypothetical protein